MLFHNCNVLPNPRAPDTGAAFCGRNSLGSATHRCAPFFPTARWYCDHQETSIHKLSTFRYDGSADAARTNGVGQVGTRR